MKRLLLPAALAFALAGGMAVAQTPTTPSPDGQKASSTITTSPQHEAKRLSQGVEPDSPTRPSKLDADLCRPRPEDCSAAWQNGQAQPAGQA